MFTVGQGDELVRLDRARLELLVQHIEFDESRRITSVPAWEALVAMMEGFVDRPAEQGSDPTPGDQMMPENGLETLKGFDAIYLGAVGDPRIPDDVTLHGLLLPIKFGFDLYVGLRPVYLFPGVDCPLVNLSGGEIDIVVIRENTEGEYSNAGGIVGIGESELALQSGLFTRKGIERIITFSFDYAREKGRRKVTSVTKSNAQRYGMVLWDRIFKEVASRFPEIKTESKLIDAACMDVVRNPKGYDVIVASNLFADILSDLTASVTGGMGLAPGASFNPKDKTYPGYFEPVHTLWCCRISQMAQSFLQQ